jgi:hypothetical protein
MNEHNMRNASERVLETMLMFPTFDIHIFELGYPYTALGVEANQLFGIIHPRSLVSCCSKQNISDCCCLHHRRYILISPMLQIHFQGNRKVILI